MNNLPPKFWTNLFQWFCDESFFEELQGDLEERFYLDTNNAGLGQARANYRKEVLKMIRFSVIKKGQKRQLNNMSMYKNFLKVAFRNLAKHKLFSFINITGMAIGMSVCLLVVNLVYDAYKFDEFHEKKNRIYRITSTPVQPGFQVNENATSPPPLASKIQSEIPEVEEVVSIRRRFNGQLKVADETIQLSGIYASENFFDLFSFELVQGDKSTILQAPNSIVLTQESATKLFPNENPMGKVLSLSEQGEYIVSGIVETPPAHSHMSFEVITSLNTLEAGPEPWKNFNTHYTYVLLSEPHNQQKLNQWLGTLNQEIYSQYENLDVSFKLQALTSIIPGRDLDNQLGGEFYVTPLIILGSIALAILLSACFNYTNLSIARALRRAKEIGIRKVVGSSKGNVLIQFTIETVLITLLAVFFSIVIFLWIKPFFLAHIPRIDTVLQLETPAILFGYFIVFATVVGILTGLIPALVFARIKPLSALRSGSSMRFSSKLNVRKALVIVQFTLSMVFLVGVSILFKQYNYSVNFDMKFQKENILNIPLQGNDLAKLLPEFEKIPEVTQISASSMIPGTGVWERSILKDPRTNDSTYNFTMGVSPSYFDVYEIEVLAGRTFNPQPKNAPISEIMVNEHFIKSYRFESISEALGKQFYINNKALTIVGVFEDFHYQSIEEPITSLIMFEDTRGFEYLNLKLQTADLSTTFSKLESAWKTVDEDQKMQAKFLDQELQDLFGLFLIFMKVLGFLGVVAISIACLGLLGMAIFNVETRVKEIGVRKAIGASVKNLVITLSKSYLFLVIIAALLGSFASYFVYEGLFLSQIHNNVGLGTVDFLQSILVLLGLSALAVGSQTWRAARANPVQSLRNE